LPSSIDTLALVNRPTVKFKLVRGVVASAFLAVVAAVSFQFEGPWSAELMAPAVPGDIKKAINLSEVFAHGLGAAAILGSVLLLTQRSRSVVWCAVLITLVSGLTANGLKGCFVRVRPHAQESIRVAGHGAPDSGREEVQESFWDSRQRSFPSGHAATAWGLAIGLGLVFPKGIWLFASFATLASLQRLISGAHFPSDVLAGAAIAFFCAALLLSSPRFRQWAQVAC
jgi:membrane-associated phospholipid phosphatase